MALYALAVIYSGSVYTVVTLNLGTFGIGKVSGMIRKLSLLQKCLWYKFREFVLRFIPNNFYGQY